MSGTDCADIHLEMERQEGVRTRAKRRKEHVGSTSASAGGVTSIVSRKGATTTTAHPAPEQSVLAEADPHGQDDNLRGYPLSRQGHLGASMADLEERVDWLFVVIGQPMIVGDSTVTDKLDELSDQINELQLDHSLLAFLTEKLGRLDSEVEILKGALQTLRLQFPLALGGKGALAQNKPNTRDSPHGSFPNQRTRLQTRTPTRTRLPNQQTKRHLARGLPGRPRGLPQGRTLRRRKAVRIQPCLTATMSNLP